MAKKRAHRPDSHRGASAPPATGGRSARPAPSPVPASDARARFEDASRPMLLRMRGLPTFVIPALLAVALFLGLVLPWAWAGLFLVAIGLFLAWLTALSWPAISPGSRLLRVLVNIGVLALGVLKVLGRI